MGVDTVIGFLGRRRHARLRDLLSAYIDGQVSESEAGRVEGHLAQCAECRLELETLRATVGLLKHVPQLEVPRSFALAEAPVKVSFTPPIMWTARLATSVAGLMLVALLLGDLTGVVTQRETPEEAATVPAVAREAPVAGVEKMVEVEKEMVAEMEVEKLEVAPSSAAAVAAPEEEAAQSPDVRTVDEGLTPPEATVEAPAAAGIAGDKAVEEAPEASRGLGLPLWQLEVGVGGLVATLALATLWTWRRGRRTSGRTPG